jgi:hypothetical protein
MYTKGASAIPTEYGKLLGELEREWRSYLGTVDATGTACPVRT